MLFQFQYVTMILDFVISMVVLIVQHVELSASQVMKGINAKHVKMVFTSAMVSLMETSAWKLVKVQNVKVLVQFWNKINPTIIKCFISVCFNDKNQVCNRYGSNQNCGEKKNCGPCMKEYQGDNCGSCVSGYFPASGITDIVNSTTGEGVFCKGSDYINYRSRNKWLIDNHMYQNFQIATH